jgi:cell division septum initiation protein DivIVA
MFGRFFDTAAVDEFADWVVAELKRTLPASFDPTLQNVADKVNRLDKRIQERTSSFTQSSRLNLYKKARLASRVQEAMTEFGYPKPFVKSFSMDVIRRVVDASRKN